jgi:hypothetical protein
MPLKLDEESKNNKPEEVAEEGKENIGAPLKLEGEFEDMDEEVEGMKVEQGPKGLLGAYWISYHNPCHPGTHKGPANLRWNR